MRRIKSALLILGLIAIMGCKSGESLKFEHDFGKEMSWSSDVHWKWNVQKNDKPYRLSMDLQCGIHYPYENLPLSWIEIKPNGDTITHELDVIIRNPDGTFNGDKALDYLNFDIDLATHHQYAQFGTYRYQLAQKIGPHMEAPFMVEFEITAKENH